MIPFEIDLLVVGAGPVGCVIAEQAAVRCGWRVLMVDRRPHIGGNCFDRYHESGLLMHPYGPHYFRTNNEALVRYLSQYTDWIPGNYIVKSFCQGQLFPFPINLLTLEMFFGRSFTASDAYAWICQRQKPTQDPANSEEFVLSRIGQELYESFYLNYTLKQWGKHPRHLDASVCGRIPIRFNRDCRYVDHRFQLTPKDGFTRLFERMVHHPSIYILLQCDGRQILDAIQPRIACVYCGPLDEYFHYRLGRLPWRSLTFEFVHYPQKFKQPCVQINYPNDFLYTRSVEIKHITQQIHPHTLVSYEYPQDTGEPYYPVCAPENHALLSQYLALARLETQRKKVYFAGRLAQYRYINTDEAMETALKLFEELVNLAGESKRQGFEKSGGWSG